MAEPKKETVRIALPPRPEQTAVAPSIIKRDTARIVLPTRTPVAPIRRLPPQIAPWPASEATTEAPTVLPRPTPTINMTKTQPLLIHPVGTTPVAPVVITSKPIAPRDAIPRSLAWGLLAISAVIFLIQIWNYVVS